jgi:hypothetical protein
MPLDRRTFVKGALGASGAVLLGAAGGVAGAAGGLAGAAERALGAEATLPRRLSRGSSTSSS